MEHNQLFTDDVELKQHVTKLINPIISELMECAAQAIYYFNADYIRNPLSRVAHDSSTKASILNNWMTYFVRQAFDGRPGFQIIQKGRILRLLVGRDLVIRFKKLDPNLIASNIPTKSQLADYTQQAQLSLPGMENLYPTVVFFGYQMDRARTKIDRMFITCPRTKTTNEFVIPLDWDQGESVEFVPPSQDGDRLQQSIVVAKSDTKRKKRS